jgi:type IV pilus assembly protein PilA
MQETLRMMRKERADGDRGFTLIELLVVVVIIGVLVAIATPVYMNYRKGAANKSAQADVRGAIAAIEQYYTDNGNVYPADATSGVGTALAFAAQPNGTPQTVSVSPDNTIMFNNTSTAVGVRSYHICGRNADGGTVYVYNSVTGGSVRKSTQATIALCNTNGN